MIPNTHPEVKLPSYHATRIRRLHLGRAARPDFSDRDLLILRLLGPHLHEVYVDAERRRRGIQHLSRREREVLQLPAQGFSNADIARILFISPATVAKHMEHIFDRTGVRTRSAAAALALPSPLTGPADSSPLRRPDSTSKASPFRAAASSSERKLRLPAATIA
jgi:DNA-binding CsgD family transcriptional regulator